MRASEVHISWFFFHFGWENIGFDGNSYEKRIGNVRICAMANTYIDW